MRGTDTGAGKGIRLAGWLAVLPFLLLSLVVPGTMLARDAQGGVTMVLCTGDGMVEVVMAADGSVSPVQHTPADHRCDWAPHAQPLALADAARLPVPGARVLAWRPVVAPRQEPRPAAPVHNRARAPPLSL